MKYCSLLALMVSMWVLPMWAGAQESGPVRGIVVEAGTSKRLGSATVTNLVTGRSAVSNSLGTFEIGATVGDSIEVALMGYRPVRTGINTLSDILIDMQPASILLEQAEVNRMSKEAELNEVMRGYRKQGIYYDGKPPALAYVFNPITSLYELFGRTPKNARRFNNYMQRELAETEVDHLFNRTRIQELTGMGDDDVTNFMFWYRPSYEKSQYWGEYDITNYIMQSYKQFDRDGRPEAPKLPKLEAAPGK